MSDLDKQRIIWAVFIVLFAGSMVLGRVSSDGPAYHVGVTARGQ